MNPAPVNRKAIGGTAPRARIASPLSWLRGIAARRFDP
jgi:hypothetical protein